MDNQTPIVGFSCVYREPDEDKEQLFIVGDQEHVTITLRIIRSGNKQIPVGHTHEYCAFTDPLVQDTVEECEYSNTGYCVCRTFSTFQHNAVAKAYSSGNTVSVLAELIRIYGDVCHIHSLSPALGGGSWCWETDND